MGSCPTPVAKCPQIENFVKITDKSKPKVPRSVFVVLVRFFHPVDGRTDYVFGCARAIYDRFSRSQIGADIYRLYDLGVGKGTKVVTRMCTIERIMVHVSRNKKPDEKK